MTHERNITGLKHSAQKRHEDTWRRAEDAIQQLMREKRTINFKSVAEFAGVSTAWLYQQPSMRARIQQLRDQAIPNIQQQTPKSISMASKDAIIGTLNQRVKELEVENRELRQQIEVLYGELYKK